MVNQATKTAPDPLSGSGMPITEMSAAIRQAFADWTSNRAYLDNGRNYRVREEPATPTHRPSGKIAPWNREVKRLFADCGEFHRAAQEWKERSELR
jgi:hypothetical protein